MFNLREKLLPQGSLREKLATLAGTAATAVANPIRAIGQATNTLAPDTTIRKPAPDTDYNAAESQTQIETNRKMGYASDELGNRTERLSREEREQLAQEFPDMKNELLFEEPETPQAEEPRTAMIETRNTEPVVIDKTKLRFRESHVADGIPYIETPEGELSIAEAAQRLDTTSPKPIKSLKVVDPDGVEATITDEEQVQVANEIAAIADQVAPEYKNYLIKLALREGGLRRNAFRGEKDNPGGGDDRGVFQINSKAFPSISQEQANDVRFATLWAISLIESANPVTGDQKREGQEKWYSNDWAKQAQIVLNEDNKSE